MQGTAAVSFTDTAATFHGPVALGPHLQHPHMHPNESISGDGVRGISSPPSAHQSMQRGWEALDEKNIGKVRFR